MFIAYEEMTLTAFRKYVQEVKQRKQYEEQSYVVAAIERKQKMPGRGGGERRFFREFLSQELRTWLLETGLWCLTQFARAVASSPLMSAPLQSCSLPWVGTHCGQPGTLGTGEDVHVCTSQSPKS